MKEMKEWTKMSLCSLAVSLFAGIGMHWLSFSNNLDILVLAAVLVVLAAVLVVLTAALAAFAVVFTLASVATVVIIALAGEFSLAIGLIFWALAFGVMILGSWEKERKAFSPPKALTLLAFLLLSFLPFYYVSQYHNGQKIIKDKLVATKFEARQNDSGQRTLCLPATAVGFQRYLSQTLTVTVAGQTYPWRQKAIRYSEGKKEWYQLPLQASLPSVIGLHFNHLWQDYDTTITLPDANQQSASLVH